MVHGIGGGWLLVAVIVVSACGSGEPWVSGTVRLADGVDPSMYDFLELRVLARDVQHEPQGTTEPDDEPVMIQTIELDRLTFPREFEFSGEDLYDANRGNMVAWMTVRAGADWWEPGEPFGATFYEMCECATHTPTYADEVVVTLEPQP